MAAKRAHDPPRSAPSISNEPQSGTRVKAGLRRSEPNVRAPSTLPPPPFETEAEVPRLEWWLTAHMGLASGLLCLVQLVDAAPAERATHAAAVRQLSALCASVRDALYELYCDAAHPHAAELTTFLPALEGHVRDCYSWCVAVVALLVQVATGLRSDAALDWEAVRASSKAVAEKLPKSTVALRTVGRSLAIDFASPVEPLRNLPANLESLAAAVAALDDALAMRFS